MLTFFALQFDLRSHRIQKKGDYGAKKYDDIGHLHWGIFDLSPAFT